MENTFLTFIRPYIDFIDHGHMFRKPFSWLYALIAIVNLVFPLFLLYVAVDSDVFDLPGKFIFVFFVTWLVIAFVSWVSFQIWWDRKSKIFNTSQENDEFVAIPVFSHFIQTLGEWIGTWIGVVGFFSTLMAMVFLGDNSYAMRDIDTLGLIAYGWLGLLIWPVLGFVILVIARVYAELIRALASIANNTRKERSPQASPVRESGEIE